VDDFYTFLGGGKPSAPAGGNELEDLLDAGSDIEFDPKDVQMDSSKLDIDLDDKKPAKTNDGKPDLASMTLAE
jgi:hypothetical protein